MGFATRSGSKALPATLEDIIAFITVYLEVEVST
jgi:hypothetical protein